MPRAVKGQAIAELLAQFLGEDISPIMDEVPREVAEVACIEENKCLWEMTFDESSISIDEGAGIVLANGENEALSMSFKFDFLVEFKNRTAGVEDWRAPLRDALLE